MFLRTSARWELDAALDTAMENATPAELCIFRLACEAAAMGNRKLGRALVRPLREPPDEVVDFETDMDALRRGTEVIPDAERIWWARAAWAADQEPKFRKPLYDFYFARIAAN